MIVFKFAVELVEEVMTTGYSITGKHTVIDGLKGEKLVDAKYNKENKILSLYFDNNNPKIETKYLQIKYEREVEKQ